MIRKFQSADTEQVMKIWLHGNEYAHPFIPKDYWKSNYSMVQEQLLQAEVYVYQRNRRAVKFYKREVFSIPSEDIEPDTGETDYTMALFFL